ncbi:MAG: YdeI/OmpD-associated family protein [Saprospiraceae bacterium]|nr:YdeI/OmpD-associated family protein [Saprospiraceae bacterium]
MTSFTTTLIRSGVHATIIPIPIEIAVQAQQDWGKRVLCTINGIPISCALQRSDQIGYYIMAGASTRKKFLLSENTSITVTLSADTVPLNDRMPEVLQEVLSSDQDGQSRFADLSDGKKRTIFHLILSAKSIDTRINRALRIIENLKRGKTHPGEFLKPLD